MCLGVTIGDKMIKEYLDRRDEFEKKLYETKEVVNEAKVEMDDIAREHWIEFFETAQALGMDASVYLNLKEQGLLHGKASNE